jgi:hypothetical protein
MCCFFLTLMFFGPRLAFLIYWLVRPAYINTVFQTWIWPLLGLIFLPWTTLMWALVYGANGIIGFDWLWIGLAVVADIASYAGGAYKRKEVPYYPTSAP